MNASLEKLTTAEYLPAGTVPAGIVRVPLFPSIRSGINHLQKEKGLTEKSNKPKGGQSEIRTRGRLPFNGFQDRLFRPLRHMSNVQCTKRQYSTAFGNLQHRTHINSVVRRQSRFVHPKTEKEDSQPRSVAKHRIVNQKTTPAPR